MAAFRCPGGWNKASGIHGWERTLGRRVFICYCGKAVRQGEGKQGKKVVKEENSMMMEKKWKKQHDSAEHKVNVEREGDGE